MKTPSFMTGSALTAATLMLLASQVLFASEEEQVYESLADVSIGKVFYSPEKRQAIDRSRGSSAAASSTRGGVKRSSDAAGYIVRSDGRTRVYADGDFVLKASTASVEFPRQVAVIRSTVADDAEAGNASD